AFDFGCVIVMQYSAESERRMAGKEPGGQNISTGNVSGGIVGGIVKSLLATAFINHPSS
ncbi:hypothetical protein BaRGS_00028206, partial [Batillaria attramentaria]